jgi:hypothetical protein
MELIEKILITLSSILGVVLIWVTIKNIQFKAFVEEVKKDLEDGKITAEEAMAMLTKFVSIFKI